VANFWWRINMDQSTAKEILEENKKVFNKIAEEFSETRKENWPEVSKLVKYVKRGDRVLDLGCGNGRLYKILKDEEVEYTGVDSSENLIGLARKNFIGPKFIVSDVLSLSFEKENSDVIFAIAFLHHLPSENLRMKFLQDCYQSLKNKGLIILTVWNLWQPQSLLKYKIWPMTLGWRPKNLDFKDVFIPWRMKTGQILNRFYHAFTKGELKKLVVESGFKIIGCYFSQKGKTVNWLKGNNLVLIAEKL